METFNRGNRVEIIQGKDFGIITKRLLGETGIVLGVHSETQSCSVRLDEGLFGMPYACLKKAVSLEEILEEFLALSGGR